MYLGWRRQSVRLEFFSLCDVKRLIWLIVNIVLLKDLNETKWKHSVYFMYRIPVLLTVGVKQHGRGALNHSVLSKGLEAGFLICWLLYEDHEPEAGHIRWKEAFMFLQPQPFFSCHCQKVMVWVLSSKMWPGRAVACNYFSLCCYSWFGGTVHKLLFHCLLHQRAVRKMKSVSCRLNTPEIPGASLFTCWHSSSRWLLPLLLLHFASCGVTGVLKFSLRVKRSMGILLEMESGWVCNDL